MEKAGVVSAKMQVAGSAAAMMEQGKEYVGERREMYVFLHLPPLSTSVSHPRLTAFLVRFAGGGEETNEDSGREVLGSEC
jgi:hypothetical protein